MCLLGPACTLRRAWIGAPLPPERLASVAPGATKAEVLRTLGPPDTVGLRLDGSVFIYRYRSESDDGLSLSFFQASVEVDFENRRTDRVAVFFDKKGVVTAVGAWGREPD